MRYFVVLPDGQKFGPADLPLLNHWASEGRVLPTSLIEEEGSGVRMQASSLPGLVVPGASPFSQAPGPAQQPYQGYYRGAHPNAQPEGQTEFVVSLVLSGISIFLCFGCAFLAWVPPAIALYLAGVAMKKGHPNAMTARIVALTATVIFGLVALGYCALFGLMGIGGGFGS